MLNIDNRTIDQLTGDEMAVFINILKRINKDRTCYPSRYLLQKETGYGRPKIAKVIKSLIAKKLIKASQLHEEGKFSKTLYTVIDTKSGVYINSDTETCMTGNSDTETCMTETCNTGNVSAQNGTLSIIQSLSINKYEVLNNLSIKDFKDIINSENFKNYLKSEKLEINKLVIKNNDDKIDYTEILLFFHNSCKTLPKVKKLTDKRKKAIKSIIKNYDLETLGTVFNLAGQSDFLTGLKSDFTASFDWILNPTNFLKILEGNYKNKNNGTKKQINANSDEITTQIRANFPDL